MTETHLDPEVRSFHVELEYPRLDNNVREVTVGLTDVRAADTIRITYDFERDGWRVGMDCTVEDGPVMRVTEENTEVAFIPAWNEEAGDDNPVSLEAVKAETTTEWACIASGIVRPLGSRPAAIEHAQLCGGSIQERQVTEWRPSDLESTT